MRSSPDEVLLATVLMVALVGGGLAWTFVARREGSPPKSKPRAVRATGQAPTGTTFVDDQFGRPLKTGLAIVANIGYKDRDGVVTERRITIERLFGGRDEETRFPTIDAMAAWCHLRQDARTFLIGRIAEPNDPETGKVLNGVPAIAGWLRKKARFRWKRGNW